MIGASVHGCRRVCRHRLPGWDVITGPAPRREVWHEELGVPARRRRGGRLVSGIGVWIPEFRLSLQLRFYTLEGQVLPRPTHLEVGDLEPALQHSRYLRSVVSLSRLCRAQRRV